MNLKNLKNSNIGILGLGIENIALVDFLIKKKIDINITICDFRGVGKLGNKYSKLKKHKNINWQLGNKFNEELYKFDILFRSPGWPINCPGIQEALNQKTELNSPMKLFFDLSPAKNTIGVTGTKGKGTTSSLINEVIKKSKKKVWLGGNIGIAPFDFIDKIKNTDWVVLELSSFQLEDMHVSPKIAVITNFTREHLAPADPNNPNYHNDFKKYREAKLNLINFQKKNNYAILSEQLEESRWKGGSGKRVYFSKSELESGLVGDYNKRNIAAAVEVAKILKIKKSIIIESVKNFKGLPHRIEFVRRFKEVKYFDNSFATTPEATIEDLKSFKDIVLIVGGADKGSSFSNLAREIKRKVKFSVLLDGEGTDRIRVELEKINLKKEKYKTVKSIKDAIKLSKEKTEKGDVVLLSTACASFGMFKNYKERGNLFKKEVKDLK